MDLTEEGFRKLIDTLDCAMDNYISWKRKEGLPTDKPTPPSREYYAEKKRANHARDTLISLADRIVAGGSYDDV